MKYLSQFLIIMGFTFVGEALQRLVPIGIPASVWGLALLFLALCLKIVKLEWIRDVGGFLISLLPVLFVGPTVGIVEHWDIIRPSLWAIALLLVGSTVLTFGISGSLTQWMMKKGGGKRG